MTVKRLWRVSFMDEQHGKIAPDILLDFDPRGILSAGWEKCPVRLMTWHIIDRETRSKAAVADVFLRWGRIWDGYDLFQHRNYNKLENWLKDDEVRPVLGGRGDAGRHNNIPPRLDEVIEECQWPMTKEGILK